MTGVLGLGPSSEDPCEGPVDRLFSTGVNSCAMKFIYVEDSYGSTGYLIPQHLNFCKQDFRTPAWVNNVISLHGS
jgi:hypothetical protein